jgi:hypothetical protein
VHDAVYGEGYLGGQDPAAYGEWLRGQGVEAIEYRSASGARLVANAKAEVALRNPVLLTIPGYWTGNYAGWDMVHFPRGTYEVDACDAGPGWLTCMNPWPADGRHAFYQRQSDAWWAARICYGRLFVCEREAAVGVGPGVPAGWQDDGTRLLAPGGVPVVCGFRARVLDGWDAALVPQAAEAEVDIGSGRIVEQVFSDGGARTVVLRWTDALGVWVATGAAVIAQLRGYTIPKLEAAEVAPLQQRISELEGALRAAQVDQGASCRCSGHGWRR